MEMRNGAMKGTARVKGRVRAIIVNIFVTKITMTMLWRY
jgi:hypothetical protein